MEGSLTLYVAVTQFTYGKLRHCYVKSFKVFLGFQHITDIAMLFSKNFILKKYFMFIKIIKLMISEFYTNGSIYTACMVITIIINIYIALFFEVTQELGLKFTNTFLSYFKEKRCICIYVLLFYTMQNV